MTLSNRCPLTRQLLQELCQGQRFFVVRTWDQGYAITWLQQVAKALGYGFKIMGSYNLFPPRLLLRLGFKGRFFVVPYEKWASRKRSLLSPSWAYSHKLSEKVGRLYTRKKLTALFFIDIGGDLAGPLLLERPTLLWLREPEMESIALALRSDPESLTKWEALSPKLQAEVRRVLGQVPFSVGMQQLRAALACAQGEANVAMQLWERCSARLSFPKALIPVSLPEKVELAGLPYLRAWIHARKAAFTEEGRLFGLPKPRGLCLVGPPGTGKSLAVHYLARSWNLPLFRLDFGALLNNPYLGETEANYRQLFEFLSKIPAGLLWIDHLETLFPTGPKRRKTEDHFLFYLFQWLDSQHDGVFLVATANRIDNLRPELLRRGRFDEVFFVDLPAASERRELWELIWRRYVEGRGQGGAAQAANLEMPWDRWVEASRGFSGAEIEQAFQEALRRAYVLRRPVQARDVEVVLERMVPQALSQQEAIQVLRRLVLEGRLRPAGPSEEESAPACPSSSAKRPPPPQGLGV